MGPEPRFLDLYRQFLLQSNRSKLTLLVIPLMLAASIWMLTIGRIWTGLFCLAVTASTIARLPVLIGFGIAWVVTWPRRRKAQL